MAKLHPRVLALLLLLSPACARVNGPGDDSGDGDADADSDADADADSDADADADSDADADADSDADGDADPELCNGLDDDGDGAVDEDDPEGGVFCATPLFGSCAIGHTHCVDASLDCVADHQPGVETCANMGEDDDCNGVDDDIPEVDAPCDSGLPGLCAAGTGACDGADFVCVPAAAGIERCDNALDDDCNGETDELGCIDQFPHHTGYGQEWFDDFPTGTYDLGQATRACEEYVAATAPGLDSCMIQGCGCGGGDECTFNNASGGGQTRRVWFYRGQYIGQTTDNSCSDGLVWD